MGTDRCAETAETSPAIRICLTSIMFHYPSQHNNGCNLLGPDPVDPSVIRFVRFWLSRDRQLVSSRITCQCRVSGADSLSVACIYAGQVACDRQTAGRRRPVLTR